MSAATVAIANMTAKHGVPITLVRPGVTFDAEADTSVSIDVLARRFEGTAAEAPTGAVSGKERWLIPAVALAATGFGDPKPYDRMVFTDHTLTISKVSPGYAFGELVRWDVDAEGQA